MGAVLNGFIKMQLLSYTPKHKPPTFLDRLIELASFAIALTSYLVLLSQVQRIWMRVRSTRPRPSMPMPMPMPTPTSPLFLLIDLVADEVDRSGTAARCSSTREPLEGANSENNCQRKVRVNTLLQ